jgi:hypothetical protein
MAIDPRVTIISVRSGAGFDPTTLQPVNNRVVTYKVGNQGPFTAVIPAQSYSQAAVEAIVNAEAQTLESLGAVPPASNV